MIVGAQGNVRGDHRGVGGSICGHDQRKVGNVSRGKSTVIGMVVSCAGRVEMRSSGLEVGAFALRELVYVQRMLTRREAFDIELDSHAVLRLRERGGADAFPLSVLDIHGER